MRRIRTSFLLALVAATPLAAQKTNDLIKEVQRDLASLQQDVKSLNSKFDEKMAVVSTLLQQALTEAGSASKGVAILDRQLRDSLKELQGLVAAPVAALGSKVDTLGTEYSALNENVKDLSGRMNRVQSSLNEIAEAIKTLNKPPAPPPQVTTTAEGPPAGVTADNVYQQAMKDKEGGSFELAMREFQDYLKWWPDGERAPNAQFYIGEIHYYLKNYEAAVAAFDIVIEKFPENTKTPDAMYLKGRALMNSEQKNKARQVLTECAKLYPNSDAGRKCRGLLPTLAPAATNPARKRKE